jgi:NAD(P)-dependent dehydrogenase (short-subunit alcohol dehydrogenase family)
MTASQWSRELRVNLDGAFYLAQAATARLLHHKRHGRVVFIGSWAAHTVHLHIPAYCVAKAGMRMLCKCMALELAPHGITVNEIAPGFVNGGLSRRVWEEHPAMRAAARKKVPVGELIAPEEVAEQVVHLCHPDNHHITGSVLLMDGGLSLVSP